MSGLWNFERVWGGPPLCHSCCVVPGRPDPLTSSQIGVYDVRGPYYKGILLF